MDDGTIIHWPTRLADRFTAILSKSALIRVVGRMETGPNGETRLEVYTVTNVGTDHSVRNDTFAPTPSAPPAGPVAVAVRPEKVNDLERRVKALEEEVAQLREEVRRLSRGR